MASSDMEYSLFTWDIKRSLFVNYSPIQFGIIASYILFTTVVGPRIMKNRKPMDLKLLILSYNLILVASNTYLCYDMVKSVRRSWSYQCDNKNNPMRIGIEKYYYVAWVAFGVKYFELLDTVFFILRKKFNQVTFLHVFHHSIVCIFVWALVKYEYFGFYMFLIGAINSAVHVLLYSYYGLSALGPSVRKYLWWKKYLTTVQIMQFVVILLYMFVSHLYSCEDNENFETIVALVVTVILILFLNFYYRNY